MPLNDTTPFGLALGRDRIRVCGRGPRRAASPAQHNELRVAWSASLMDGD